MAKESIITRERKLNMFTMDDLFDIATKIEKNGESVYTNATEKIKDQDLKSMLKWMANEEASHARWFSDKKNSIRLEIEETRLKKMVPQVFQEMMGEKTLGLEEIDFSEIKTVSHLLDTFIGFENDTIMFYELLETFISEEKTLDGLKNIILEEKSHIQKLESMKASKML
jgi:rubrerythrin